MKKRRQGLINFWQQKLFSQRVTQSRPLTKGIKILLDSLIRQLFSYL
jgi:hypothetical protein